MYDFEVLLNDVLEVLGKHISGPVNHMVPVSRVGPHFVRSRLITLISLLRFLCVHIEI